MGGLSRRKGGAFERSTANDLKRIFGDVVKRGLSQCRFGVGEAPDVDGAFPFWIECKVGKHVQFQAALQQAVDGMELAKRNGDRWPIAVCKVDKKKPMVLMNWEHFLELVQEWQHMKEWAKDNG